MHFHLIFECKFSLLCARFLHIFLLNFDRIFDDFRQILGRRGTSEASGATSWHLGGSKSEFLMNFGGSRVSFWSPWATLGTSVSILWPHFMTLFCMHVFKCVFGSVFYWILEALDPQKWVFRLRGVAKTRKSAFSKKVWKIIDFGITFWCIWRSLASLGPLWDQLLSMCLRSCVPTPFLVKFGAPAPQE